MAFVSHQLFVDPYRVDVLLEYTARDLGVSRLERKASDLILDYGRGDLYLEIYEDRVSVELLVSGFYREAGGDELLPFDVVAEVVHPSLAVCEGCSHVMSAYLYKPCERCSAQFVHTICGGCGFGGPCCHWCDQGRDKWDTVMEMCGYCEDGLGIFL